PDTWGKAFPIAVEGKNQSPIDIQRSNCKPDDSLKPVTVDYSAVEIGEITNTGSSWKAQVTGGKPGIYVYVMSMQLHLVHWDTENFKSFGEAAAAHRGLAVLGIFLKVGKANPEFDKLTKLMAFIPYMNQTVNINEKINCVNFLPHNRSYFTYDGSLTTPPCYESVNWIVFEEPVEISPAQLAAFRSLKSYPKSSECPCDELKGCMVDNYRPCCPLNDRTVRVYRASPAREE
ncbi:carbonic anhydrase-like, partial [Hyalella azteca]|uniref:carbonic anhydrase n=1 Tax=Hyalella azteca TaxID=294128 RepID=A0A8B7P2F2_HYAAZ